MAIPLKKKAKKHTRLSPILKQTRIHPSLAAIYSSFSSLFSFLKDVLTFANPTSHLPFSPLQSDFAASFHGGFNGLFVTKPSRPLLASCLATLQLTLLTIPHPCHGVTNPGFLHFSGWSFSPCCVGSTPRALLFLLLTLSLSVKPSLWFG